MLQTYWELVPSLKIIFLSWRVGTTVVLQVLLCDVARWLEKANGAVVGVTAVL